jgi:anti-anti-sigma factor
MKHHLTASPEETNSRKDVAQAGTDAALPPGRAEAHRPQRGSGRPHLRLASVSMWTHTLKLTGELHHGSAHLLEAEIDRLCEQGVSGIMLDLRGLSKIDAAGVAVIVFRFELCRRRGCELALIRGSQEIQRAFERAGAAGMLPFRDEEIVAASLRSTAAEDRRAEAMGQETLA